MREPSAARRTGRGPAGAAVVGSGVTIDGSAAVPAGCDDLHNTILKATPTRQTFGAAFGSPDSMIRSVEPNRHVPGALDSLFTVYYPGLAMSIRTPEAARDMATHVHIESNRYLAYPGIGIGTTPERLVDFLGDPSERDQEALTWDCSEHVEQPVTFRIVGGRVHAIDITYYVD
ncbi:MAG: hypothetical protein ACRELT_18335 [Longimicrobiales bacterium]